jgi:hypothetical protein
MGMLCEQAGIGLHLRRAEGGTTSLFAYLCEHSALSARAAKSFIFFVPKHVVKASNVILKPAEHTENQSVNRPR